MKQFFVAVVVCWCSWSAGAGDLPTLKQIMEDPSWIARSPEPVGWLPDGGGVLFDRRREGVIGRDTSDRFVLELDGVRAAGEPVPVADADRRRLLPAGVWSPDGGRVLAEAGGDVFCWEAGSGWRQLTRTGEWEWSPTFMADGRIAFRRASGWFVRDGATGLEAQAAEVRFEKAPGEDRPAEPEGDMERQQWRLFRFVRENDERRRLNESVRRERRRADAAGVPGPFYLDPERREDGQWLSPSGGHLLVATTPRNRPNDPRDLMPDYVTETGSVRTERLRVKVGYETRQPVGFVLLDLAGGRVVDLALEDLPGIQDDPLAEIRRAAEAVREAGRDEEGSGEPGGAAEDAGAGDAGAEGAEPVGRAGEKPGGDGPGKPGRARAVGEIGVRWSESGRHAAVMLRSHDNKDRWLVAIDTHAEEPGWIVLHHARDPAWIQWEFNRFGFVPGTETVWFESEHSGWGHLYLCEVGGTARALTAGAWEARGATPLRDGSGFVLRTNRGDHGVWELERVSMGGSLTALSALGGTVESFEVAPGGDRVAFVWSDAMSPPELYAVAADGSAGPERLTRTDTDLYRSFGFVAPEFHRAPSSHAALPVHMRAYRPDPARFPGPRPVVVFAHGAGYLQFANRGWSYYLREHLFHSLLADRGILVLGPDFRHSEGYGRDWRAAVYRDMGEPELRDLDDCLAYAAEHLGADAERVGIYGGSYGGFLTLMAMFTRPEVYDAGAALRSVTDWRHYSHGWTSNPLDTPQVDPEPFDRCSPITHAEGLRGSLLMCHGLVDDNVVAQDVIRLSQRLIELEKTGWELALYPVEPHGFREPSSWLDEYRRILALFERALLGEG